MSADSEARRIAAEVLDDFRRMFPGTRLTEAERQYLGGLIVSQVRDALEAEEDDHR